MNIETIVVVIFVSVVVYLLYLYNKLVTLQTRIDEGWSGIDVQLKRRAELIPNLVSTVKGFAKHEEGIFKQIAVARSAQSLADTKEKQLAAHSAVTGALKSLFAVAEAYPKLTSSQSYLQMQKELGDTEDKIAYARQYYNTQVLEFIKTSKTIPGVWIAQACGFSKKEYISIAEMDRALPAVHFETT